MNRVVLLVVIAALLLPGCAINKRLDKLESYIESDKANTQVLVQAINKHQEQVAELIKFDAIVNDNMSIISCYVKSETPGQAALTRCIAEHQMKVQEKQSGQEDKP